MSDGVTAHDQRMMLFRCLIDCLVQSDYNLRTGLCGIVKVPSVLCRERVHLHAPSSEDIKGGKIMLDQCVAPVADPLHIFLNIRKDIRMGRIQAIVMG